MKDVELERIQAQWTRAMANYERYERRYRWAAGVFMVAVGFVLGWVCFTW